MSKKLKTLCAAILSVVMCLSLAGCDNRSELEKELDRAAKELEKGYNSVVNKPNSTPAQSSKPEPKPLDPFADVKVTFKGISPLVTAEIKGGNSNVTYTLDKNRDLALGDKVTVTAELRYGKDEDYVLTADTKEFTVENRPAYIMKLSDLTDSDIEKLGAKVVDLHRNVIDGHKGGGAGSTINSFDFLGNILYTYNGCQYLYFIYKANTTFEKATTVFDKSGNTFDYYFLGYYQYVYKETDGTLNYYDGRVKYFDLGDKSMLPGGFNFGGYLTLDGLYSQIARYAGTSFERESNVKE